MTGIDNQLKIRARVDVSGIRRSIEDALKRNAEIEADNIIVDVSGSQVTLRGDVQTLRERAMAERAVWAVPGVTVVKAHLSVA